MRNGTETKAFFFFYSQLKTKRKIEICGALGCQLQPKKINYVKKEETQRRWVYIYLTEKNFVHTAKLLFQIMPISQFVCASNRQPQCKTAAKT